MRWWKKALLYSVLWLVLLIVIGMVHTDVILKDHITPEQDYAISRSYGHMMAAGLVIIWVIADWRRRRSAK